MSINTIADAHKAIKSTLASADKAGLRLTILTAALCRASRFDRDSIGFTADVVSLSSLRAYFRKAFNVNNMDESGRKLITRATAIGFEVSESMPSMAGYNDFETVINAATNAVGDWKAAAADRKAAAAKEKADKEAAEAAAAEAGNVALAAEKAEMQAARDKAALAASTSHRDIAALLATMSPDDLRLVIAIAEDCLAKATHPMALAA